MNLTLQSHRDIVKCLSNLLSNQLKEESSIHTLSNQYILFRLTANNSTETEQLCPCVLITQPHLKLITYTSF